MNSSKKILMGLLVIGSFSFVSNMLGAAAAPEPPEEEIESEEEPSSVAGKALPDMNLHRLKKLISEDKFNEASELLNNEENVFLDINKQIEGTTVLFDAIDKIYAVINSEIFPDDIKDLNINLLLNTVIRRLIEKGANPDAVSTYNEIEIPDFSLPIIRIEENISRNILEVLFSNVDGQMKLDILNGYYFHPIDETYPQDTKFNPLYSAILSHNKQVIRWLLDNGADRNYESFQTKSAPGVWEITSDVKTPAEEALSRGFNSEFLEFLNPELDRHIESVVTNYLRAGGLTFR